MRELLFLGGGVGEGNNVVLFEIIYIGRTFIYVSIAAVIEILFLRLTMTHVCTTGDLPIMIRSVQLFANKFFLNEDRIVISCLEEWLYNSTRDSFLNIRHLDVSYYRNLDFVLNQIKAH